MSNFLSVSIGRKFLMSITGIFMMLFICVHLTLNLFLVFDDSGDLFNVGANFMSTNPLIKIMEPILALGFIIHIIWAFIIYYNNYKTRPIGYAVTDRSYSSNWNARNMLVIGALVLTFLVIHLINFYCVIKFDSESMGQVTIDGTQMHNTYALVAGLFKGSVIYGILYMVAGILLGFHLSHGFWSAFHTIGFNNENWIPRLIVVSKIFAVIVATGFSLIPLYFMIKF